MHCKWITKGLQLIPFSGYLCLNQIFEILTVFCEVAFFKFTKIRPCGKKPLEFLCCNFSTLCYLTSNKYNNFTSSPPFFQAWLSKFNYLFQIQRRKSLPPPKVRPLSWEEYICSIERYIHLGRPMVCKETRRHFKATLAMVRFFLIIITISGERNTYCYCLVIKV